MCVPSAASRLRRASVPGNNNEYARTAARESVKCVEEEKVTLASVGWAREFGTSRASRSIRTPDPSFVISPVMYLEAPSDWAIAAASARRRDLSLRVSTSSCSSWPAGDEMPSQRVKASRRRCSTSSLGRDVAPFIGKMTYLFESRQLL